MSDEAADGLDRVDGWLLIRTGAVPDRWRDRAISVDLIPLLPDEFAELFDRGDVQRAIGPEEEEVARLAARGLTVTAMARELGVSTRTVDRRLASLRDRLGVSSTAELAVELARRGF